MPPRLPAQLRRYGLQRPIFKRHIPHERPSTCFFCSLSLDSNGARVTRYPKKRALPTGPHARRLETTTATTPTNAKTDARKELELTLLDLQKHAANYVNLSRLQLALNGLRQERGHESIRVAILGLAGSPAPNSTAKDVLRLLLADPLKDAEAWEYEVEQHDLAEPMIIRIGAESHGTEPAISLTKGNLLREIYVSSAALNGHNLEILLADTNPFLPLAEKGAVDKFEDTVLVPSVDIPTSNTGQYTPITTPVHKALIVADGLHGAASIMALPAVENPHVIQYAVNIPEYKPAETTPLPFTPIDTSTATIGLGLIRKNIANALKYEHLWFQSNMLKLVEWLKADILTSPDDVTKPPVRELISSLLGNAATSIREEESRLLEISASSTNTPTSMKAIEEALSEWAEGAHAELQEQLDIAFSSRRWRKLGWWKLFWRVDDVGMLTSDILTQKFLPEAERNSIFLAGRMREAGVSLRNATQTSPIDTVSTPDSMTVSARKIDWPINIPNTRSYLQMETVPALQALAQKLVLQTLSTSGLMTALGALVYVGTLTTTLYEAGAVAALGIVWSMRRMQKQWERAREFWEGEVREEGRKAVRGVEEVMASALTDGRTRRLERDGPNAQRDLKKANELVTILTTDYLHNRLSSQPTILTNDYPQNRLSSQSTMAESKTPAAPAAPAAPANASPGGGLESKMSATDIKFCCFMMKYLPAYPDINWDGFANDMGFRSANVAKIRKKHGLLANGAAAEEGETPKALKPANDDNKVTKSRKTPKPRKMKNKLEDSADIIDDGNEKMKLDHHDGEA
ncbi:hypothetical protein GGR51DRAFT_559914 [Nemania sp. FL0031]|nr:hypothetical protein GGR51DRAFT_559914 [Nemania sp. FL0031]